MASVAVNDCVWNATKQLADHVSLVVLGDRVEGLLDNVAAKGIHAEGQHIAVDGVGNGDDLLWSAMFEAALNEEVAEAIDHQRVCLINNGADDLKLLLSGADFELLLKEDGSLLVVTAHDLVHDILPVAGDSLVKKATVVHGLERSDISRVAQCRHVL